MDKIFDLIKKYSTLILTVATTYWFFVGLFGTDVILLIFVKSSIGFLIRILYLAVGIVGAYNLLEKYKPALLEDLKTKLLGKCKKDKKDDK